MQSRDTTDIKKDLQLITSSKLSSSQSTIMLLGVLYDFILRKDIFPKNENLKEFIESYFVPLTIEKTNYKDYLYTSRTLLGSRLCRTVLNEFQYDDIIKLSDSIEKYLPTKYDNKKRNTSNASKIDKATNDWMNYISKDNK